MAKNRNGPGVIFSAPSFIILLMCALGQVSGGVEASSLIISEFMASNQTSLLDGYDESSDWIEIYNPNEQAASLGGWYLTDNAEELARWPFPEGVVLGSKQFLVVFASGRADADVPHLDPDGSYHTNFRLDKDGEFLALVLPDGVTVHHAYDHFELEAGGFGFPPQKSDLSYGVAMDNPHVPTYFDPPATPGAVNGGRLQGLVADISFSVDRGFFDVGFALEIATETPDAKIYYTLDGSEPSEFAGIPYAKPIVIDRTSCVRAVGYKPGYLPTSIATQTYLFVDDIIFQSPEGTPPPGWPNDGFRGHAFDYGMDPDIVSREDSGYYHPDVRASLKTIPTFSIVTDLQHLFDRNTGIYTNSGRSGIEWERPVSLELIDPNGSAEFQVNAGLRIRGASSRTSSNPQYSFHVYFRGLYGASHLDYPLFGNAGATRFDRIDIRTDQGLSWNRDWHSHRHTLVREVFARDLQLAMGRPATRTHYYHLYLNGVYWGIYETQEYPDEFFAVSYFGGREQDYDIIRVDWPNIVAKRGNLEAYYDLWDLATQLAETRNDTERQAIFQRMQGNTPDGLRHPNYPVLLDVDNFIDYMLVVFYTASIDGPVTWLVGDNTHNWFVIRDRTGNEGFKFFVHDSEYSMGFVSTNTEDVTVDRTGPFPSGSEGFHRFNPQWLHQQLALCTAYRERFDERVSMHLFGDGVLTPQQSTALFMTRVEQIDQAIIAGSARWGDFRRSSPLTHDDWAREIDWLVNTFIAQRTEVLLDQLRAKHLYQDTEAELTR